MTVKEIIKNGGATINKNGEVVTLKSGYQVSYQDGDIIDVSMFTLALLQQMIKDNKLARGQYLGIWVDNGKVYFDLSKRVATKHEALDMGKALNQIGIWDWKNQKTINCNS